MKSAARIAVVVCVVASLCRAGAVTTTWNNTGTDFSAAGSWTSGAPSLTTTVEFSGTPGTQPILSGNDSANAITFGSTAGWTLGSGSSSYALTLGGAGATNVVGIDASALTDGTDTVGANIALAQNQIWQVGAGGTLAVSGVISGAGRALTIGSAGNTGTVVFSGANTYTGGTTVAFGTLQLSGAGTLGAVNSAFTISSGTVFDLNGVSAGVGQLTVTGTIVNNGSGVATLTFGNNNTQGSIDGLIKDNGNGGSGQVALDWMGNSTSAPFKVTSANTYSGGTTVTGTGQLRVSNIAGLGTGTIAFNGGQLQYVTNGGTVANAIAVNGAGGMFRSDIGMTLSGAFTGTGSLLVTGNQGDTLSGDFSGYNGTIDTEFSNGKGVTLNNTAAHTEKAAWVIANATTGASFLAWGGTPGASGSNPAIVTVGLGSLSGGGNGILEELSNSTIATFQVGALGATTTYGGQITDGGGGRVAALQLIGGRLTLAGVGTYTGGTTVTGGTLVATGAAGGTQSGTTTIGSKTVTVASTAGLVVGQAVTGANIAAGTTIASINSATGITLSVNASSTGTAAVVFAASNPIGTGPVLVNGGTLLIGANLSGIGATSVTSGALTLGSGSANTLSLASGKGFSMTGGEIDFVLSPAYSQILSVGGAGATYSVTGGTFNLSVLSLSDYAGTYNLFSGFTSGSVSGVTLTGYDTADYLAQVSSAGVLTFTAAVPEPATWALLAGAGAALAAARRRRVAA